MKKIEIISERIVNISDLENLLERERILIEQTGKELERNQINIKRVKQLYEALSITHKEVVSFEFCLEHRKIKKKARIFPDLFHH